MFAGRITIPAPHGQLEAIYKPRRNDAERVALLLHPHPQHGGTMHNKVIFRSAKALEDTGYETLRFNYRGVDGSSGTYDNGRGEEDDAKLALAYLREAQPAAQSITVLGFSFGAAIALSLRDNEPSITKTIALGTPAYGLKQTSPLDNVSFIHGESDDVAPLSDLKTALAAQDPRPPLCVVPDADHFFTGKLTELQQAVREFSE